MSSLEWETCEAKGRVTCPNSDGLLAYIYLLWIEKKQQKKIIPLMFGMYCDIGHRKPHNLIRGKKT